jgi:ribonuclease HI
MSNVHFPRLSATAYTSGSSQISLPGGQGEAGCGALLYIDGQYPRELHLQQSLGTNVSQHEAEYYALQLALHTAAGAGVTQLQVLTASELVVDQMLGNWNVRSPYLQPLHEKCLNIVRGSGMNVTYVKIAFSHEIARKMARGAAGLD